MPNHKIKPESDNPVICYRQKLSWKISEEDWKSKDKKTMYLELGTKIPGSFSTMTGFDPYPGGCVGLSKDLMVFGTDWPKNVDFKMINIDACFSIKIDDSSSVKIVCNKTTRKEYEKFNRLAIFREKVQIDPELLYDKDRCFTLEAELQVTQTEVTCEENAENLFAKDIKSIFHDSKNSDVVVIAGNQKFHCHKNILGARCEVFKNMLAPNTIESESSTIEVKEVSPEAVESMLKYIYSGEIPDDEELLTLDLLNIAEMYLLDPLKEACLKSLVERLEVSTCISTFIMADRYLPIGGNLREKVIMFMRCKGEEVVGMKDWDKLVINHPALATELMRAILKGSREKHCCQFCVVSYQQKN